jgi:serine/alanine adding enzyme
MASAAAESVAADVLPVPGDPLAISDTCTETEWDQYVENHPLGTSDHLAGWKRIFRDVFGHESHYLAARRGAQIVGVLPVVSFRSRLFGRFFVSVPFLNYGGVLASDASAAGALAARAKEIAVRHGAAHVEYRHRERQFAEWPCRSHKIAVRLSLPLTSEALWSEIDRKARNQVRRAQKERLTTHVGGGELVGEFYTVFSRNMRDLGTPVYPTLLFRRTLDVFAERSRIYVVRLGSAPIAAAITIRCADTVLVPWASSLREHRHLCANMLLYWTMLERSIVTGARTFDFGRSSPGAGTHAFKAQWGGVESPLYWEYQLLRRTEAPDQGPGNPRFQLAIDVWKRLPLRIATAIGPAIVRHIP